MSPSANGALDLRTYRCKSLAPQRKKHWHTHRSGQGCTEVRHPWREGRVFAPPLRPRATERARTGAEAGGIRAEPSSRRVGHPFPRCSRQGRRSWTRRPEVASGRGQGQRLAGRGVAGNSALTSRFSLSACSRCSAYPRRASLDSSSSGAGVGVPVGVRGVAAAGVGVERALARACNSSFSLSSLRTKSSSAVRVSENGEQNREGDSRLWISDCHCGGKGVSRMTYRGSGGVVPLARPRRSQTCVRALSSWSELLEVEERARRDAEVERPEHRATLDGHRVAPQSTAHSLKTRSSDYNHYRNWSRRQRQALFRP